METNEIKRTCHRCKTHKPLNEFFKDKSRALGHGYICKVCHVDYNATYQKQNKEKYRAYARKSYHKSQKNPEEVIDSNNESRFVTRTQKWRLAYRYGLTLEDYCSMLIEQNDKCAICGHKPPEDSKPLAVDHCHTTGKVRGLLCTYCNQGLGHFKDNIESLKQAIKYLKKSK